MPGLLSPQSHKQYLLRRDTENVQLFSSDHCQTLDISCKLCLICNLWLVQQRVSGLRPGQGHRPRVFSSDSDPALDEYFMTTGFLWLYIKWPKTVLLAPVFAPDHPRGPESPKGQQHLDEAEHEACNNQWEGVQSAVQCQVARPEEDSRGWLSQVRHPRPWLSATCSMFCSQKEDWYFVRSSILRS